MAHTRTCPHTHTRARPHAHGQGEEDESCGEQQTNQSLEENDEHNSDSDEEIEGADITVVRVSDSDEIERGMDRVAKENLDVEVVNANARVELPQTATPDRANNEKHDPPHIETSEVGDLRPFLNPEVPNVGINPPPEDTDGWSQIDYLNAWDCSLCKFQTCL